MHITLKAASRNELNVLHAFVPLIRFFNDVMEELPTVVENIVAYVIASVFEEEGSQNDWAPLAPYTQRERTRLGYGAEHPILVREGVYRGAFVDSNSPFYVSENVSIGESSFIQRIGTTNPLFPWHEKSTRYMPARPATPVGDEFVFEVIVEELNEYLTSLLEETRYA